MQVSLEPDCCMTALLPGQATTTPPFGGVVLSEMATPIGFEPTVSTVTGWRVRPLHHGAAKAEPTVATPVPVVNVEAVQGGVGAAVERASSAGGP